MANPAISALHHIEHHRVENPHAMANKKDSKKYVDHLMKRLLAHIVKLSHTTQASVTTSCSTGGLSQKVLPEEKFWSLDSDREDTRV